MFGIDSSELAIIALVALLVIGPKDLPRVMRMGGQWLSKGRAMTRHVRAGFDTMMREAEIEEMQKQWAAQNEAIMKATALPDLNATPITDAGDDDWMAPPPPLAPDVVDTAPAKPRRARAKPAAKAPAAEPSAAPKRKRAAKPEPATAAATDSPASDR